MGTILMLFIAGLLVGAVGAFLGIGGGVIIVPLLSVVFGYPVHEAVATSLAIVVANSLITSRQYLTETTLANGQVRRGAANVEVALFIAMFSVIGSLIGSSISLGLSGAVIYIALGSSQLLTIVLMLTKKRFSGRLFDPNKSRARFETSYYDGAAGKDVNYGVYNLPPTAGISAFSGVLSGLVGVGGGVMIVPAMNIFSGIPMKAATATSALIMGFTAAGGGIVFFLHGLTHATTVMIMVPAIYIGSKLAVKAAVKVSGDIIYRVFMVFLFLVACQMLYKGFTS